ncbi:MAG: 23S rRNA (adenine(2503)-C(2))-methyltransferase RlmN [Chloroflexota bacterium]
MIDLLGLTKSQLVYLMRTWDQPEYRARQIWHWIYRSLVQSPEEMANLPLTLRSRLVEQCQIGSCTVLAEQKSSSGNTDKVLLSLDDGESIEVVLMRYPGRKTRYTVCVSTQVGCAMGCSFCATGQMGFMRQLSTSEIVMQVVHFQRKLQRSGGKVSNVVFMGMGEPMLNYDSVLDAIQILADDDGLNLGARRFTISTIGVIPGILRMAEEKMQVGLAVSLHAATQELREELLPAAGKWRLDELMDAIRVYSSSTGRRVTFEWALIHGVNDSAEQARALASLIQDMICHVNLIPLNPTEGYSKSGTEMQQVEVFQRILEENHIPTTIRLRRGIEIEAGCGQLRKKQGA